MDDNISLTIGEKIDRAKDGRTQKHIVKKMNEAGIKISEVQFTRKKAGDDDFSALEIQTLSEILSTDLTK